MEQHEDLKEYKALIVTSKAFSENQIIPKQYTCEGKDINPSLDISGIPEEAKSLALIVDDPDAPKRTWVHWVVWNIPITHHLGEDTVPGQEGMNDFGRKSFGGPCPPSGVHRYFFKVYALDCMLDIEGHPTKKDLERAMDGHIIAFGELIGRYQLTRQSQL